MTDSVSPLAALDVSAARDALEELAEKADAKAQDRSDCYDLEEAQAFARKAELLRHVSAALASLPALLADGARIDALEAAVAECPLLLHDGFAPVRGGYAGLAFNGLVKRSLRDALDQFLPRAVRPAGAAPEIVK